MSLGYDVRVPGYEEQSEEIVAAAAAALGNVAAHPYSRWAWKSIYDVIKFGGVAAVITGAGYAIGRAIFYAIEDLGKWVGSAGGRAVPEAADVLKVLKGWSDKELEGVGFDRWMIQDLRGREKDALMVALGGSAEYVPRGGVGGTPSGEVIQPGWGVDPGLVGTVSGVTGWEKDGEKWGTMKMYYDRGDWKAFVGLLEEGRDAGVISESYFQIAMTEAYKAGYVAPGMDAPPPVEMSFAEMMAAAAQKGILAANEAWAYQNTLSDLSEPEEGYDAVDDFDYSSAADFNEFMDILTTFSPEDMEDDRIARGRMFDWEFPEFVMGTLKSDTNLKENIGDDRVSYRRGRGS